MNMHACGAAFFTEGFSISGDSSRTLWFQSSITWRPRYHLLFNSNLQFCQCDRDECLFL